METQLPRLPYPKGCTKTARPLMTNHRGRTWDSWRLMLPDGRKTFGHLDTSWGENFYWLDQRHGYWMKAKIDDFKIENGGSPFFDLRETRYGVQIGQKVRLKPEVVACAEDAERTAHILLFYSDVPGGLRLDAPLAGHVSWNITDVEPIYDNTIRTRQGAL